MDINFMQPSQAPQTSPDYARMAQMLMQRGGVPQGQAANAPGGVGASIGQLAGAAIPMWGQAIQADANKAATALNGGVATVGQAPAAFSKFGNMLSGLFGA